MRWSVTRFCGKLYVRMRSLRSPAPTTGARGAEAVDAEVVGPDLAVDPLGLRNHRHRDRGGVDPPPRLRGRHPLNPMDAALVLQPAVGAPSLDHRGDFLGSAPARSPLGR